MFKRANVILLGVHVVRRSHLEGKGWCPVSLFKYCFLIAILLITYSNNLLSSDALKSSSTASTVGSSCASSSTASFYSLPIILDSVNFSIIDGGGEIQDKNGTNQFLVTIIFSYLHQYDYKNDKSYRYEMVVANPNLSSSFIIPEMQIKQKINNMVITNDYINAKYTSEGTYAGLFSLRLSENELISSMSATSSWKALLLVTRKN